LATGAPNRGRHALSAIELTIGHVDKSTSARKRVAGRFTNTRRAAGDERDATGEIKRHG
jgi:hypothetical protein